MTFQDNLLKLKAHKQIDTLVFEGGGVLGTAYVGVLQSLDKRHIVKQIKNYAGSSAGSIAAGFMSCNASLEFIEDKLRNINFSHFEDCNLGIIGAIYNLYMHNGLYKGDILEKLCEDTLKELTNIDHITFKQHKEIYGNNLTIVVTNLTTRKRELFNWKTQPKLAISHAMRMSSSVPSIFIPVEYNGCLYVDGGVTCNYPIDVFDTDLDTGNPKDFDSIIGFKLMSDKEYKHESLPPITNIVSYLKALYSLIYHQALQVYMHWNDFRRTIQIDIGDYSSMNFTHVTEEMKEFLIKSGIDATEEFLDKREKDFIKKQKK